MMPLESDIRWAMAGVQPGDKIRTVCPFCTAEHEKSFEVRRMTDKPYLLAFRCYRGSCDQHGYVVDKDGASMVLQQADLAPMATPLTQHDHPSDFYLQGVAQKYGIDVAFLRMQGVRYGDGQALCMPWRDQHGRQVGWVEKRFDKAWHKSHHDLCESSGGRLAFPSIPQTYRAIGKTRVCILVEGLLDAYRVNNYALLCGADVTAVALLGAALSKGDALQLGQLFRHVMVCLDPDMWPKGAMRLLDQFAGMFTMVRATTLHTDPKDAEDAALEELFDRCRELQHA
jgi:hypothetical protein